MDNVTLWIARYSLQLLVVVAAAEIASPALDSGPPRARLSAWRAVLLVCLLLPLAPPRTVDVAGPIAAAVPAGLDAAAPAATGADRSRRLPIAPWHLLVIGALVRVAWLTIGVGRLQRMRSRAGEPVQDEVVTPLRRRLAPAAEIRWHDEVAQPVTFGVRRPLVLVPRALRELAPEVRSAVICHELLHTSRRDWPWVVGEEVVRSVFWFHPAVWRVLSRIDLAREQTVDADSVAVTGSRQQYIEALLAFVDRPAHTAASPFARRHHVVVRIKQLKREASMSRTRLAVGVAVVAVLVVSSTWSVASAVPLRTVVRYQSASQAPPAVSDPSTPRVIRQRKPDYPPEALPYGVEATTTVTITIATTGDVVKAHTVKWRLAFDHEIDDPTYWASHPERPFVLASERAARAWTFAPLAQEREADLSFTFRNRRDGERMPTTPPAASGVKILESGAPEVKVVRVGGDIRAPERLAYVAPVMPPAARDAGVEGVVFVEARIGTDGSVVAARIERSIPLLDEAALAAVRQWRFAPTAVNGEPVEVLLTTAVAFVR